MGVDTGTAFTIRDALADFVERMEQKLQEVEHRHPDGWARDRPIELFYQADDRLDLLYESLEADDLETAGKYAVDVANWMMMIADRCGVLTEEYGK